MGAKSRLWETKDTNTRGSLLQNTGQLQVGKALPNYFIFTFCFARNWPENVYCALPTLHWTVLCPGSLHQNVIFRILLEPVAKYYGFQSLSSCHKFQSRYFATNSKTFKLLYLNPGGITISFRCRGFQSLKHNPCRCKLILICPVSSLLG